MNEQFDIWLSPPDVGEEEKQLMVDAITSNWIAPAGPHLKTFENHIASVCQVEDVVALNSGTAAIHLGLKLLGVEKGDEVMCQSFTFCASTNPILYLGAHPVFIDSEMESWNMDPNVLEDTLKKRKKLPKCLLPVHLYGMPAKMKEINEIAEKYSIPVLEDAAEALGSKLYNKPCGSLGDLSALSFNGNKIITTSGGGALLGSSEKISKALYYATQAKEKASYFEHSELGYNYRMSNLLSAFGIGQIQNLDQKVRKKREVFCRYEKYFDKWNKLGYRIEFQNELAGFFSNRWLTCIVVDPKLNNGVTTEKIRLALHQNKIESRPLWKPMHLQLLYKNHHYFGGKNAEDLFLNGLCLPSGTNLTDEDFERIFEAIEEVFN